ncbi:MAG: hypothetical protein ACLT8H_10005 [Streptococcus parasanguinis]
MDGFHALFDGLVGRNRKGCIIKTAGSQVYEPGQSRPKAPLSSPEGQVSLLPQKDGG